MSEWDDNSYRGLHDGVCTLLYHIIQYPIQSYHIMLLYHILYYNVSTWEDDILYDRVLLPPLLQKSLLLPSFSHKKNSNPCTGTLKVLHDNAWWSVSIMHDEVYKLDIKDWFSKFYVTKVTRTSNTNSTIVMMIMIHYTWWAWYRWNSCYQRGYSYKLTLPKGPYCNWPSSFREHSASSHRCYCHHH